MSRLRPGAYDRGNRVLAGRFRDPLVGRDVLVGILASAAMALMVQAPVVLAHWIPLSGMTPVAPSRDFLLGPASVVARVLLECSNGPLNALGFMTLFSFGLVVLRKRWLSAAFLALIVTLIFSGETSENYAVLLPAAIAAAVVFVFVAIRPVVLAVAVILVVVPFLAMPFTLNLSRWYAGRGLVLAVAILAATIWAFWTSLGGRRALGALRLGDA